MGKAKLAAELFRLVSGKTTFLKVARAATKGNFVQKGMELQGKEAVRFFDKVPGDFQKYVSSINPETLTVRYGVKGYKGSSVTGFQVFDGENAIAKGALGIDKTYGNEPILQFRAKFCQNNCSASINFKYNGNQAFNGSVSSNSIFREGKYSISSNYGETINLEYSETGNFSDWLEWNGWKRFDNIQMPTARQVSENESKLHKLLREFVSGRRKFTPKQREQMRLEELERQGCKASFRADLKAKKERINEEMQREIEKIRNNPDYADLNWRTTKEAIARRREGIRQASEIIRGKQQQVRSLEQSIKETEKEIVELQNRIDKLGRELVSHREIQGVEDFYGEYHKAKMECYNLETRLYIAKNNLEYQKGAHLELLNEIKEKTTVINEAKALLKTEIDTAKSLRAEIAKQIKAVRAEYKAKLAEYSPSARKRAEEEMRLAKLAEKQKGIIEQEHERILRELERKTFTNKSLKEQLMKEDIQQYDNVQVVNKIKKIKGSGFEVAEQSKNIFLTEMGFDPALIEVKEINALEKGFNNFSLAFEPISGRILIAPQYKGGNLLTSAVVRHELDHFQLFADLCKSIGVENFKKMLLAKTPQATEEMFNTKFWNKAIKNAKILSQEDVAKYTKAYNEYELPDMFGSEILSNVKYYGNPIETRAYDIQASIGKSLGINSDKLYEGTIMSRIFRRIRAALDKIEQTTGREVEKDYLEKMMENEILKVKGNDVDIYKVLNNLSVALSHRVAI